MTTEERKKIYAALAAPFPESCIQRTDGRVTGRGYDTTGIGYQFICNRINEVLGVGGWRLHRTVTVREVTTAKGRPAFEAICDVTLELGEWVDGDFVVFAESLADGGHVSSSEADARKAGTTSAFKKAAAMLGCGRQAYEGTLDDDNVPPDDGHRTSPNGMTVTSLPTAPAREQVTATSAPVVVQPRSSAPARNRLSSKQLAAIWAIGRKLGYEQTALRQHIKSHFGVQPEFLSREQASHAIGALSQQAGNGHADEYERQPEEG